MKKQILSIVATLSILVTLAVAGFAGLSTRVSASIPFDFMIGNKQLPAGKYTVERGNVYGTLVIRSTETKGIAVFQTLEASGRNNTEAKLVFRRYGNQYFLAQVHDGLSTGSELIKSKAEREAARAGRDHLALNSGEPEIISVVANVGQ
ncbi:MAG TPA: hypothetical protein VNQ79_11575 [Blastocatellia bacterium]|nr:hypothetical protein [Blastocatellia bacterium]